MSSALRVKCHASAKKKCKKKYKRYILASLSGAAPGRPRPAGGQPNEPAPPPDGWPKERCGATHLLLDKSEGHSPEHRHPPSPFGLNFTSPSLGLGLDQTYFWVLGPTVEGAPADGAPCVHLLLHCPESGGPAVHCGSPRALHCPSSGRSFCCVSAGNRTPA